MATVMAPIRPGTGSNFRRRATLGELHPNTVSETKLLEAKTDTQKTPHQYGAKAALQLDLDVSHLISSPYPDFANQLELANLDTPYQLFAFALTALKPVRDDYATAPYLESFNWSEVFHLLHSLCHMTGYVWEGSKEFYVVIFRSKLQENADRERLGLLDKMSHQEACQSGGLLKYWFGSPDAERHNLATCLWRNHADAVAGGSGPWHKQARGAARVMYEKIDFHVHKLVIEAGVEGWRLEQYR